MSKTKIEINTQAAQTSTKIISKDIEDVENKVNDLISQFKEKYADCVKVFGEPYKMMALIDGSSAARRFNEQTPYEIEMDKEWERLNPGKPRPNPFLSLPNIPYENFFRKPRP